MELNHNVHQLDFAETRFYLRFLQIMRLKNTLRNRIGMSVVAGAISVLVFSQLSGRIRFDVTSVLIAGLLAYVPITIVWAVISVFFNKDDQEKPEDILDN